MYTGIVQGLLPVKHIDRKEGLTTFSLQLPDELMDDLQTGASIAVNGVCLTVARIDDNKVTFDAIAETLATTNLDALQVGTQVNVERSAHHGAEVGGHVLSGHIVGKAAVADVEHSPNNCRMTFASPAPWLKYVFEKGFLAVNGASLTVAKLDSEHGRFAINLIPETLERTNFAALAEGDEVNIEVDSQTQVIVDTVERVMAERYAN